MFYANRSSVHARECCVCRVVVLSRSLALARCPLLPRRWQCETGNYRLASTAVYMGCRMGENCGAKNSLLFLREKGKISHGAVKLSQMGSAWGRGRRHRLLGRCSQGQADVPDVVSSPAAPALPTWFIRQFITSWIPCVLASYSIDACSRHQSSSGPNTSSPTQPLVHHDKDSTRTCELAPRTGIRSINSTAESGV